MKIWILTAIATVLTLSVSAQENGKIVYERKVNMHKGLSPENENIKNMVPEFTTSKMELNYSGSQSLFKMIKQEEDIRDEAGMPEGRMVVRFNSDNETYKDYSAKKAVELRELGPKKYIIEDSLPKQQWKLNDETKTIKGILCKQATTTNLRKQSVVAWYAESIPCPSGPEGFGGLPGLILELNINDGELLFTALEITSSASSDIVKAPSNGKKITRKEFQKMMDEQFGPNEGGGPQIRIIRN